MGNLKTKDPLLVPDELAEVYVVYNNRDYRMTLGTLITLVTKATIGLDRVDNTSDDEKPISSATASALLGKANKTEVPTIAAFNALADSLSEYVTLQQLNLAINEILDSINGYATTEQVQQAISTAILPIMETMQALSDEMSLFEQRLLAVEQGGAGVDMTVVSQAIQSAFDIAVAQAVADNDTLSQSFQVELALVRQSVQLLDDTLMILRNDFDNHEHSAQDIVGLQDYILSVVGDTGCNVVLGENEW